MMFDREVLVAVALLSSMLTAIPIVLLALLARPRAAAPAQPEAEKREPEAVERWEPESYDGYHWEPTDGPVGDPYSFKRVRNSEGWND